MFIDKQDKADNDANRLKFFNTLCKQFNSCPSARPKPACPDMITPPVASTFLPSTCRGFIKGDSDFSF